MQYIQLITLLFFISSCTSVASNISKKLPRKLEDAKVYQINDTTWTNILKEHDEKKSSLVTNKLDLDISYNYINNQINSVISSDKHQINFFQENIDEVDSIQYIPILKKEDRNILILKDPIVKKSSTEKSFEMSIKYYMKKQLIDAGIFSIPVEKSGFLQFSFGPEIKNNVLSMNTRFEKAEGGLIDEFSSFAFKGFINLFLKGLNDFDIPESFLNAERIALKDSPVKLGYKIYNLDASVKSFTEESMNYKINSDFSLFFNDSGFVNLDSELKPTLSLDINVLQSAIDKIMADRNNIFMIKGDTATNDFFYFDSIKVVSDSNKISLHTRYKGNFPLTVFDYGINGEMDFIVHPIILNNKLYLNFDEFIFYGEKKETDLLSSLLNILISETIQQALYVDLNTYLPSYDDVLAINDAVSLQNVQAHFTKGMVKDGKLLIFAKMSAMLKFN